MITLVRNLHEIHSRKSVLYANCGIHEILMSQLAAECQQRASFVVIQHSQFRRELTIENCIHSGFHVLHGC